MWIWKTNCHLNLLVIHFHRNLNYRNLLGTISPLFLYRSKKLSLKARCALGCGSYSTISATQLFLLVILFNLNAPSYFSS